MFLGSAVLTNELGKTLPQAFLSQIPGGVAGAYSSIPYVNSLYVPDLASNLHQTLSIHLLDLNHYALRCGKHSRAQSVSFGSFSFHL